jgi:hypothetical protein
MRSKGNCARSATRHEPLAARHRRRPGNCDSPRGGRRLRHHGRKASRWKRCARTSREFAGDRIRAGCPDRRLCPEVRAHFNPVVTLALALRGDFEKRDAVPYVATQFIGALAGVAAAHAMFDMPVFQYSVKARSSLGLWWSEAVATFGLVLVILSCDRARPWAAPLAVAGYIAAAYWFTASTSFANPAVTLARGFTNTFAGVDPSHAAPFIAAQLAGAGLALLADRFLPARPA